MEGHAAFTSPSRTALKASGLSQNSASSLLSLKVVLISIESSLSLDRSIRGGCGWSRELGFRNSVSASEGIRLSLLVNERLVLLVDIVLP